MEKPIIIANGELRQTHTQVFKEVWNDKGSGASKEGGLCEPLATEGFRPMGSVVVGNHDDINGHYSATLVGPNSNASATGLPPVASPSHYTKLWSDEGTKARHNGSLWRPVLEPGYVAMGDVMQIGYNEPSKEKIYCLRSDLTRNARFGNQSVWDDTKSGAKSDLFVWETYAPNQPHAFQINCFRGSASHNSALGSNYAVLPVA